MVKSDPCDGKYMACCLLCCGDMVPKDVVSPLPPSRPSASSILWTGTPLTSRLALITSFPLWYLVETWPKSSGLCACWATPQPSLRSGLCLDHKLTWCMPSMPLFTDMWVRAWRKESFLRPVRTWLPLRKIMRRLVWILLKERERKERNTNYHFFEPCSIS